MATDANGIEIAVGDVVRDFHHPPISPTIGGHMVAGTEDAPRWHNFAGSAPVEEIRGPHVRVRAVGRGIPWHVDALLVVVKKADGTALVSP